MKKVKRIILADIKAAAFLSRPEAVELALRQLRELPEISGNQRLSQDLLVSLIQPASQLLGASKLPSDYFTELSRSPLAADRALAGGVLLYRWLRNCLELEGILERLAQDRRKDVREALVLQVAGTRETFSQAIQELAVSWLQFERVSNRNSKIADRLYSTALQMLASINLDESKISTLFASLDLVLVGPESRSAMVDLLTVVAEGGYEMMVFSQLGAWVRESDPESWVICRTLSKAWALKNPVQVNRLLDQLENQIGPNRQIAHTREALKRKAEI